MYRTHCTRDTVHKYNPHILGECVKCGTSNSGLQQNSEDLG